MKPIQVGTKVKCKVSGFVGIVTTRAEYLHGTPRLNVQAESKDNKIPDEYWVNEESVEVIE